MGTVDEIKQRTDIVDVIGQYVTLTKAGRNFRALCPFHSEKNPSFFVYPQQQSWHCFGSCNTGGDVFSFVMKKQNIEFGEALHLLAERAGVTIPARYEAGPDREERGRLYQANEAAARYFHDMLINSPASEKARGYLTSRGLVIKSIMDFQLGYSLNSWDALKQHLTERGYSDSELLEAGLIVESEQGQSHDRFRNKLMFPIHDSRGRVTGFGGRVLDDSLPKYINSPQTPVFDKSASLYGINLAQEAIRERDMAVIVEGYMDVITAHQYGFANVIAPMGIAITDRQIGTLKKISRNITLALDSDTAGEGAMLKGIEYENALGAEVKVMVLPPGKDPDDVVKEDIRLWERLLEEAIPVTDYTFKSILPQFDLTTARGKSLAAQRLLPIVGGIKDPIRQAHYLQKLARLLSTSIKTLETALGELKTGQGARKKAPESRPTGRAAPSLFSSPLEEYCLALLLQHPELKAGCGNLLPEYFENSENREIFLAYLKTEDILLIRENIDSTIWENLDSLLTKSLPPSPLEPKLADCILRLQEKYLRNLETKKEAVLALEAESKGASAELAKLKEQGIEASIQLGRVFSQRGRGRGNGGRK